MELTNERCRLPGSATGPPLPSRGMPGAVVRGRRSGAGCRGRLTAENHKPQRAARPGGSRPQRRQVGAGLGRGGPLDPGLAGSAMSGAGAAADRAAFVGFFPQVLRDLTAEGLRHPELGDAVARLKEVRRGLRGSRSAGQGAPGGT